MNGTENLNFDGEQKNRLLEYLPCTDYKLMHVSRDCISMVTQGKKTYCTVTMYILYKFIAMEYMTIFPILYPRKKLIMH